MNSDAWNSHGLCGDNGTRIDIKLVKSVVHHHCSRCQRDFAYDLVSGKRYAVKVAIFALCRLPDRVSRQWLDELCPGAPTPLDTMFRSRGIENRSQQKSLQQIGQGSIPGFFRHGRVARGS
jgi:hypothetical protein